MMKENNMLKVARKNICKIKNHYRKRIYTKQARLPSPVISLQNFLNNLRN
ncbi:3376_t:CDS:2 [Acaulospora colombiana]|uniref:3376_t:CDS:1 n=1 Tax=Acaulospora colombiana TaxID=27376 RepID=A0ACA9LAX6_9GLOM|nr:3376_t:CDS:2 [Acaulospora colombiana]